MAITQVSNNLVKQDLTISGGTVDNTVIGSGTPAAGTFTTIGGTLASSVVGTTQSAGDNSTKIATTGYVETAIANLADSAPSTLDTLNELAAALGDDPNFATTVTNNIATKLPLAGGTLTGDLLVSVAAGNPSLTIKTAGDGNNPHINYRAGNSIVFDTMLVASAATDYWRVGYGASGSVTSEFLAVTSAGNVGIGTSSPDGTLHVKDGVAQVYIQSNDGQPSQIVFGDVSDASRGRINYDSSDNMIFENTNLQERMRIAANGNVGIGTASPTHPLEVTIDSSGAQDLLVLSNDNTATSNSASLLFAPSNGIAGARIEALAMEDFSTFANRTADLLFYTRKDGTLAEKMRIDASGNLQLGNTNGSRRLNVFSDTDRYTMDLRNESGYNSGELSGIVFSGRYDSSNNVTDMASIGGGKENTTDGNFGGLLSFFTRPHNGSDTERMRIDSSGNVGIGTSSPAQKLDVSSSASGVIARITGPNSYNAESGLEFSVGRAKISGVLNGTGGTPGTSLRFYTMPDGGSVTERMRIDSSGNVGIGTSSPLQKVHSSNGFFTDSFITSFGSVPYSAARSGVALDYSSGGARLFSWGTASARGTFDFIHLENDGQNQQTALSIDSSGHAIIPAGVTLGTAAGTYNAANTLDDYEEGTWTPAVNAGSISGTSITYTGSYTKIGRQVFIYFNANSTSGDINISSYVAFSGLPFSITYVGTGTVITEDIDVFDRQGYATISGTILTISKAGSSSGTNSIKVGIVGTTS